MIMDSRWYHERMAYINRVMTRDEYPLPAVLEVASTKHGASKTVHSSLVYEYPFWNPNNAIITALTVDMDYSDSEMRLAVAVARHRVPAPDYYTLNVKSGRIQASWIIRPLKISTASNGVLWLYSRVLESLRSCLHGDPCFTDARRRNPFKSTGSQSVFVSTRLAVHTLTDMAAWLHDHDVFNDGTHEKSSANIVRAARNHSGHAAEYRPSRSHAVRGTRNDAVFRAALSAARNGEDALMAAESVICDPPLPESELRQCAASAERIAHHMNDDGIPHARHTTSTGVIQEISGICSEWGRKGGLASTERQSTTRRMNLSIGRDASHVRHVANRDAVLQYIARFGQGGLAMFRVSGRIHATTASTIARHLGISRSTVLRCLREIRDILQYDSHCSISHDWKRRFHDISIAACMVRHDRLSMMRNDGLTFLGGDNRELMESDIMTSMMEMEDAL